jgi:hypothetical protein
VIRARTDRLTISLTCRAPPRLRSKFESSFRNKKSISHARKGHLLWASCVGEMERTALKH